MELPPHDAAPRRQLSQDVASYVRELIISGQVRRGEFLRIDSIAKAMRISSTPVREGLLLLQVEGFVRLSPRRGFQVVGFTRQDVRDIFWVQAMLAGELTARATLIMSEAEIDELERLEAGYHEATRHAEHIIARQTDPVATNLGHRFHRAINLGAQSNRLAIMLGTMTKQLPNRFYGMIEGQVRGAIEYHPQILAAIRARDPETARKVMIEHIIRGGEELVNHLENQGIWSEDEPAPAD